MSGYLCADCLAAGVVPDYGGLSGSHVVACAFCGAVDETATYQRNAVDVIEGFGTLMNQDGTSNVQFWEYREKLHEVGKLVQATADRTGVHRSPAGCIPHRPALACCQSTSR